MKAANFLEQLITAFAESLAHSPAEARLRRLQQEYQIRLEQVFGDSEKAKRLIELLLVEVRAVKFPLNELDVDLFDSLADMELKIALIGRKSDRYRKLFGEN